MTCRWHAILVAALCAIVIFCAAPARAQSVPALRITAPNGATSVLMGSIHIAVEGLREPHQSVLDDAKVLVLEKDPQDGWPGLSRALDGASLSAFQKTGLLPPAPWARALTDEQVREITRRVSCNLRAPLEAARHTTTLLLAQASALSAMEVSLLPCRPALPPGREAHLSSLAGPKLRWLETQAEVEPLRLSIPNRIYLQHIEAALGPRAGSAIDQVAKALNTGDYDLVAKTFNSMTDDDAAKALYEQTMIVSRNRAWLPSLMRFLDEGHAVVVVGAMHLPGAQGLIQLLQQRGYRVEARWLPAR